jgi:hypothetical protein
MYAEKSLGARFIFLMIWGYMRFDGMGTIVPVEGNAQKYMEIVDNNLWQVIARHFPNKLRLSRH